MRRPPRPPGILLLLPLLAVLSGRAAWSDEPPPPATSPAPGPARVLMIDGGGRRELNYLSHLLHVQQLREVLIRSGVAPERITVFASDGEDPADDLAVREPQPEPDFWLLEGTPVEGRLRTPVVYANSALLGTRLEPATRAGLDRWFARARRELRRGDTLLVYVTDHGTKNADDLRNNKIVLWGKDETLTVQDLRRLLGTLDPGVRVVLLMSQCYSGAFAHLATPETPSALPRGNVCGYFSVTADRPAYGCYPENRGRANVGHSFHFIEALRQDGRFDAAHARVLVDDASPDVPFRTSDQFLDDLLHRVAGKDDAFTTTVDDWLRRAWDDRGAWEPDLRLLDAIGHAFGYFSPRTLGELDAQAKELPDIADQLKRVAKAWDESLESLNAANFERFTAAQRDWGKRLADQELAKLSPDATRALAGKLLKALPAFTAKTSTSQARLAVLHQRADTTEAIAYRMEVRLGGVLRMRTLLTSVAGRAYLAAQGTPAERQAYDSLRQCEDVTLSAPAGVDPTPAFPAFDDDLTLADQISPAWMGIQFKPVKDGDRDTTGLPKGAVAVVAVYPDSPAQAAGLDAGDVVTGPVGAPFAEPNQIREWTMLSKVDTPYALDVVRDGAHREVTLVPKAYPRKWPSLPGPPKVGAAAPPLHVGKYRGDPPTTLADGKSRVLFFWATWCGICKASVPELLAYAAAKDADVVAITDETAKELDPFFQQWGEKPFPALVASDAYRRDFVAYGVSGTPTFVVVDGGGNVTDYVTGYKADKGLGFGGWKWASRPATQH